MFKTYEVKPFFDEMLDAKGEPKEHYQQSYKKLQQFTDAKQIPARYVSGYLYVGENSALVGDAASHAWIEVMVPGIE